MPFDPAKLAAYAKPSGFNPEKLRSAVSDGTPDVGLGEAFARGFMGAEEQKGFSARNISEEVGQSALPMAFGSAAALGTANPAIMAGAAGAGRAVQSQIQGKALPEIAKDTGKEAALNYIGAKYIAPGIAKGLSYVGKVGTGVLKWLGTNTGGVSKPAYEFAEQHLGEVGKYIGAEPGEADKIAMGIRESIGKAVSESEGEYRALIEAAKKNPKYAGKTFDLQSKIGDESLKIADEFGYQSTPGLPSDDSGNAYWKFSSRLDNLKNATLDEVYRFQRQLNSAYREAKGPLKAAFGQLKGKTDSVMGSEVGEIGQANSKWAAARALDEESQKLGKSDDLIGYVNRVFKNPLSTGSKETLETIGQKVPAVGEQINNARAYNSAQAFTPYFRSLPQTGYGAELLKGLMLGGAGSSVAAATFHDPIAAAAAAAGTAALGVVNSPRAYYGALRLGQALPGYASRAASPAYASGIEQAYRRLSLAGPLAAQERR